MEMASNLTEQQVTFFAQRSTLRRYLVFYVSVIILYVLIVVSYFFLYASFIFSSSSLLFLFVLLAFLVLVSVILFSRMVALIVRKLAHQDFTLALNHKGITVAGNNEIFLSWAEIRALSRRRYLFNYLSIYPKDPQRVLKQFGPMRRILLRLSILRTGTPISVPGWFFSVPVEQILLQIVERFGDEVRTHEIQVRLTSNR